MRAIFSMLRRGRGVLIAAIAGLALAGCASYGYPGGGYGGGYGDGYGYPGDGYGQQYGSQVVGAVQGLDERYNRIILTLEDGGYGYGGREVALQYDGRTRLVYRGQLYPVEGLERGDVIRAEVADAGNRLYARTIEVVRNIREYGGGGYYPGGGYGDHGDYEQLRGRVTWVDDRAQVIRLDAGGYGGQAVDVRFDTRTYVEWRGDRYPARDLDPRDVVSIQARRSGNTWVAERIVLESNSGR